MLSSLALELRADGYDESGVRRVLGVADVPGVADGLRRPGFLRRCREDDSPAARWVAFWLLGQELSAVGEWVEPLLELGLLERHGARLRALCSLTPCSGAWLFADPLGTPGVSAPGGRAFALARLVARAGPSLDVNCGPGTQGILSGGPSFLVDPDPRALAFARLNAVLNGVEAEFGSELPQASFALVTATLPFGVPPPALIEELRARVSRGGTLAVACSFPLTDASPQGRELVYAECSVERYAASLVDRARLLEAFGPEQGEEAYELAVREQLERLESAGVRSIADAVLIFTAPPTRLRIPYPLDPPAEPAPAPVRGVRSLLVPDAPLPRALLAAGYTEEGLRRLFDHPEALYEPHERAGLVHRCLRDGTPAAQLALFWLLGRTVDGGRWMVDGDCSCCPAPAKPVAADELSALLEAEGLIVDGRPQALLFPCLGHCFFTDLLGPGEDRVYWLGPDSLALARCTPRTARGRALDLCTGSGVQAVLNRSHCSESWAVDCNPRAVEFARRNARLNGRPLTVVQSDLYAALPPGKFELITANPPFVPTPRGDLQLFRPGGESGEEVTASIIAGLPEWLEVGGTLALVSQCPVLRGSHPLDRVEGWLGATHGWGLAQIRFGHLDRESLIASHVRAAAEFEEWLESYVAQGIEGADLAITLVRRFEPESRNRRAEVELAPPRESISLWVEEWLSEQLRHPGQRPA